LTFDLDLWPRPSVSLKLTHRESARTWQCCVYSHWPTREQHRAGFDIYDCLVDTARTVCSARCICNDRVSVRLSVPSVVCRLPQPGRGQQIDQQLSASDLRLRVASCWEPRYEAQHRLVIIASVWLSWLFTWTIAVKYEGLIWSSKSSKSSTSTFSHIWYQKTLRILKM